MIGKGHLLSLTRQPRLLDLSRSSLDYESVKASKSDLALMAAIDVVHLQLPFYETRRLRDELHDHGFAVGRQHTSTLMRRMGMAALYPKRRLSKPAPGRKIYPYLLARWTSRLPAKSGAPTSRTCPWHEDFATWSRSWTGRAAGCFLSGCLTPSALSCIKAMLRATQRGDGMPVTASGRAVPTALILLLRRYPPRLPVREPPSGCSSMEEELL